MRNPLNILLTAGEKKQLKKLNKIKDQVNSLEAKFTTFSDIELRSMSSVFKERLTSGESLDDIMCEAFAVVREGSKRTLGQRHYDVQILGGAALHFGFVAEMKTGEGKTLVATLPAYLNALAGKGVHVVTTNDYLAKRDSEWMGRVFKFLGLEVGVILAQMDPVERKKNYLADITYGTNNEFGFDYLRDNMAMEIEDCVQREHNFAIVDEVDSILIDEARTPLIISGPADTPSKLYTDFANIARSLLVGVDYEVDLKKNTVGILEPGIDKVEKYFNIKNLYDPENTSMIIYLNNSLKAKELYKIDKDYILANGELLIVDEHTGRVLRGRRYSEGLHQSLEAKENVKIKDENQTLATITLQNYFRLYKKLSGMTGTALTEASEFLQIYKLGVIAIPTNKDMIRKDREDIFYKSEIEKFKALVLDIEERHKLGQPILVGTVSVEKSELLSKFLIKRGVKHEVLNAKNNQGEASIIARAGKLGAVTVSTNMAGRGTDIMLGGNPDFQADFELQSRGISPSQNQEEYEKQWPIELASQRAIVKAEHEKVVALGGLYVLGTERHESRRIDNQLRGRSGRQGDPGETRFYLSLQDDLMLRFNSSLVERLLNFSKFPDDLPIEAKMISKSIKSAQTQLESMNFEMRKNILKYDNVMSAQRAIIYTERRKVLLGEDVSLEINAFIKDTLSAYIREVTNNGFPEDWKLEELWRVLKNIYPITITHDDLVSSFGGVSNLTYDILFEAIYHDFLNSYKKREEIITPLVSREIERKLLLVNVDKKWREHLYEMDYLQEGIGLRAMAQRDPLVEYQKEGFLLFGAMVEAMKEGVVNSLFKVDINKPAESKKESRENKINFAPLPPQTQNRVTTGVGMGNNKEVSRNSLCPCGSNKKYKRCHGDSKILSRITN
jgi:preprotein translocase subunit SecA